MNFSVRLVSLSLGALLAIVSCSAPAGNNDPTGPSGKHVTTFAGTGIYGSTGDGGPALSATLNTPLGISFDPTGNLYIADSNNSKVRVVDTNNNISTFAGTGVAGYNTDSVAPTSAQLNRPCALAAPTTGTVYIADQWNNRIRLAASQISTFAGNGTPAYNGDGIVPTAAELSFPAGVCVAPSGNIYIADQTNHRVRLVDPTLDTIVTYAGNGLAGNTGDNGAATAARITSPYAVVIDSASNLYISDPLNNVVRKVSPTNVITTYAGTGTPGYTGDNGPAAAATLSYPAGLALDSSDNLYIADSYNNVVRMVSAATGTITTVAGNGSAGFSPDGTAALSASFIVPQAVAINPVTGDLYVADSGNNMIRVVK